MKKIFITAFAVYTCSVAYAQNIGIGTTTPTRAKLELHGGVGSTAAIFGGESTGISLQRNYPGIGFNQYWDGTSRYMSNGYSAMQYLDPTNGQIYMNLFPFGLANTSASSQIRSYTIAGNGNISIRSTAITNASLFVEKAGNVDGSAIFSGTQFASFFHNGFNEDTYIRGGLGTSNVIINDISNGSIQLGGGSAKVGINTLPYTPLTALEVNGAVSLHAATINIVHGSVITVGDRSFISINATQTGVTNGFSITDGINPGQILILTLDNSSPSSAIISEGTSIALAGSNCNLLTRDTLMLIWTGARWVEISRSANHFG